MTLHDPKRGSSPLPLGHGDKTVTPRYTLASIVNDLIETSKDGELGFQACATNARSPSLKQLFYRRAGDCAMAAGELQELVARHGGVPEDAGSAAGAVRRFWVMVRDALIGSTDRRILEECVRGEQSAIKDYRSALYDQSLPQDVRAVIERQLAAIETNLEQAIALRAQARAAEAAAGVETVGETMARVKPVYGSLLWDPEAYRDNFVEHFARSGSDYTEFLRAYRYGHETASDPQYADRPWRVAAEDLRQHWETNHPGHAWKHYGEAVHHAWSRVRKDD